MPGLITHYLFGADVYNYISDERIKNIIVSHKDAYNLGLQGPDFFFYDIWHALKHKGFNYGRLMHTNQTGTFMLNLLKCVSNLSGNKKEIALAYTYGFLGHFALDATAHPYILYMACFKTDTEADRLLSSRSHAYFETAIDAQMLLQKRGMAPEDLERIDLIDIEKAKLNVIAHVISIAFNKTYNQYVSDHDISTSFKNFKHMNMFIQDDNSLKLSVLTKIETNLVKSALISGITYRGVNRISWDVLNRNNSTWYLPWNNIASSNKSFIDIYDDAAMYAFNLINDVDNIINYHMKTDKFLSSVGNRSYITGLDCNTQCNMKYFRSKKKEIVK